MRGIRIARLHLVATLLIVAGVGLAPTPARADGFGWYAYFFDYAQFLREYPGFFKPRLARAPVGSEFEAAVRGSAFELLDLMEQSQRVPLTEPRLHDGELLGAEALREFAATLERRFPGSPARFLATGRQFLTPENMPPCRETHWIHGACGAAVIYTPAEVARLWREIQQLVEESPAGSDAPLRDELLRLRTVVREAALTGQAIFFYGHD